MKKTITKKAVRKLAPVKSVPEPEVYPAKDYRTEYPYPSEPVRDLPKAKTNSSSNVKIYGRYDEPTETNVWDVSYDRGGESYTDKGFPTEEKAQAYADSIS